MKALPLVVLVLALAVSLAAAPGESSWRMKADYAEACSCHLFCQCYFSDSHGHKHAEHPFCEFNVAVTVREGHSGNVDLASTKYWLTGDLGDKWGHGEEGDLGDGFLRSKDYPSAARCSGSHHSQDLWSRVGRAKSAGSAHRNPSIRRHC